MTTRIEKLMDCLNDFPRMTIEERKAIEDLITQKKDDGTFVINSCIELIAIVKNMRFQYRYQPLESVHYV